LRLTRRAFVLGGAAVASAGAAGLAFAQRPAAVSEPTRIEISANPIVSFAGDERSRFGALDFRSGLDLRSSVVGFGGFSGLWRSGDGRDLVALTDNTQWLTARVETRDGRLAGLSDPVLAPLLDGAGRPLRRTRFYDTEGLAIAGNTAFVSVERNHAVLRFDWGRNGVRARAQMLSIPADARKLPDNSGLEAIGEAPPRSPLAGALVAIAERAASGENTPTIGYILTGSRRGSFQVARSDDFDVTDLAFLPNGEVLLLERHFSLLRGVGARLRRLPADAIRPGATVDGEVIYRSEASHQIDNMEGLCVHRQGAETIVTMISDDNFSALQRTLLLEFALVA
jgi:hypothetical protein